MSKPRLTVGLIGYQFMGKAHSNAYRQAPRYFDLPYELRMKTLCGRNERAVKEAAHTFGWESTETDWRRVVDDPEIDIVDISTPGSSHCEIAVAAAEAGKMVWCEKPIGNTLAEAEKMADAVQRSGKPSLVFHTYRKTPAAALARQLIDSGKIGQIYHVRAVYLQDWIADPDFPLVWRLQKESAGSGALGDIGSHIIDLCRYFAGDFAEVNGTMHTFVKQRRLVGETSGGLDAKAGSELGDVTVDDACMFLARLRSGALGTFEASRFAYGRKNYNRIEVNGSKGSFVYNIERMNELEFYSADDPEEVQGFRLIQATDAVHPYAGSYWPAGHIIGYEHTFINAVADALFAIAKGEEPTPNMRDGLANQRVLDAVERSHETRSWISL